MERQYLDFGSSDKEHVLLKLIAILVFAAVMVLVLSGLVQPVSTASAIEPARHGTAAQLIQQSTTMSYQINLPLVLNRYPINSIFGVQLYHDLSSSTGFTRAVELAVSWVRVPVYWSQIEPVNTTPDQYNWSSTDSSVQAARDANMKVIFTLDANPTWAASKPNGPVTNTADLLEFMGAVVARYPNVLYWEIYNEPDSISRFGTHGNVYAALLTSLYPVIKSANPSAQVVLGGLAMDWFIDQGGYFDRDFLPNVLVNCVSTCFDVANFHYYPAFRGTWNDYGPDIIGKATYMRQTMAAYQFTRPLIATETGWPSATNWGSPELAARYVAKIYARSLAADLSAAIWFAMVDSDSSNPGLLDSVTTPGTLVPRPAYQAYRTLSDLLSGARYLGVAPTIDPLEGYQFSAANGKRIDIYWYDCPLVKEPLFDGPRDCTNTKPHQISASRVGVIDKLGVKVVKNDGDDGAADGKVTLTVGSSPLYIDYDP